MFGETLRHSKSICGHYFFVKPADCDYLVARWALANGLYPHFFWNAAQTLEKYLKCSLLLNGCSVNEHGHSLTKLYSEYKEICPDTCIQSFRIPHENYSSVWDSRTIEDFLGQLDFMGSPDSRYGAFSWWRRRGDMPKFDQLAFEFRRTTIGLDWIVGEDWIVEGEPAKKYEGLCYRDLLLAFPRYQVRAWFNGAENKLLQFQPESHKDGLARFNAEVPFEQSDFSGLLPGRVFPAIGEFQNGPIARMDRIFKRNNPNDPLKPHDADFLEWLLVNVKLSKEIKKTIKEWLKLKQT